MFSRKWWLAARDRAARSAAQGFLLLFGTTVPGWMSLDWKTLVYGTVGAAVLSLATSVAFPPVPKEDT